MITGLQRKEECLKSMTVGAMFIFNDLKFGWISVCLCSGKINPLLEI
jgi:hypothetical protein